MTPIELHGKLHVDGIQLIDEHNKAVQLYGMSSWGQHKPEFMTKETFETLKVDWHTNCVRLALYVMPPHGYLGEKKDEHKATIYSAIDAAIELGMYVIVDWHVLGEKSPLVYMDESVKFFTELTAKYGNTPNILYEICNEPNGPEGCWDNIFEYAQTIIPVIRKGAPDSVILVGTPSWSQEVDKPVLKPLDFKNIMYSLHFYAATHKEFLRNRMETALKAGLPIFVNEFNICTCTGNGELDYEEGNAWKALIEKYNMSFICWNLSNWDETSSVLKKTTSKTYGWTEDELNDSGVWFRNWCLSKQ